MRVARVPSLRTIMDAGIPPRWYHISERSRCDKVLLLTAAVYATKILYVKEILAQNLVLVVLYHYWIIPLLELALQNQGRLALALAALGGAWGQIFTLDNSCNR
jgi:hypothetical protein